MTAQVEVKFCRVADLGVNNCPWNDRLHRSISKQRTWFQFALTSTQIMHVFIYCRQTPQLPLYKVIDKLTWKNVATAISGTVVIVIAGKEASMVPFLHHYKCHWRLVIWLKRSTSLAYSFQLIEQNLVELTFTHTIPVQHGSHWEWWEVNIESRSLLQSSLYFKIEIKTSSIDWKSQKPTLIRDQVAWVPSEVIPH